MQTLARDRQPSTALRNNSVLLWAYTIQADDCTRGWVAGSEELRDEQRLPGNYQSVGGGGQRTKEGGGLGQVGVA